MARSSAASPGLSTLPSERPARTPGRTRARRTPGRTPAIRPRCCGRPATRPLRARPRAAPGRTRRTSTPPDLVRWIWESACGCGFEAVWCCPDEHVADGCSGDARGLWEPDDWVSVLVARGEQARSD